MYCTVEKFLECGKAQQGKSNCTCPTPCVTNEYVPTTSFSLVLGKETTRLDEKSIGLQRRLSAAREISYR